MRECVRTLAVAAVERSEDHGSIGCPYPPSRRTHVDDEHINYRQAYNSGFSGVSRYAQGTSARDIKGHVDYVLRNGTVTDRGMVGNIGRTVGYDRAGNPVSGLEIIVRDGMIKTAYPVGVP